MKKIIKGKVLNTDTAKLIGEWNNGYQIGDFAYCYEDLYLTRAGVYFLHFGGGANSCYGVWHGDNGGSGEDIKPLSYDQARQWAEERLSADDYARHFEIVSDEDSKLHLSVSVSARADAKLRKLASKECVSLSQMIDKIITEYKAGDENE